MQMPKTNLTPISHLKKNMQLEILGFCGDQGVIERLIELGCYQGGVVRYLGRAPFNGPLLFMVNSTKLALRDHEASSLQLLEIRNP